MELCWTILLKIVAHQNKIKKNKYNKTCLHNILNWCTPVYKCAIVIRIAWGVAFCVFGWEIGFLHACHFNSNANCIHWQAECGNIEKIIWRAHISRYMYYMYTHSDHVWYFPIIETRRERWQPRWQSTQTKATDTEVNGSNLKRRITFVVYVKV